MKKKNNYLQSCFKQVKFQRELKGSCIKKYIEIVIVLH